MLTHVKTQGLDLQSGGSASSLCHMIQAIVCTCVKSSHAAGFTPFIVYMAACHHSITNFV